MLLSNPRFSAVEVIQIASKLTVDDGAFIVGGQATNLWAWFYRDRDAALRSDAPITSKDIDYFGSAEAAALLAAAIGGEVRRPSLDDMNTPNTAVVIAQFNGKPLVIDFLNGVIGVTRQELENGVSIIRALADVDGQQLQADIAVMHPILCLKSRVANMLEPLIMRRDAFAWRQLQAAVAVVCAYIDDALSDGDWKEAKDCLISIFEYVRSNPLGRNVESDLGIDLLEILRRFKDDARIDERYRQYSLAKMIKRIEMDRARRHEI